MRLRRAFPSSFSPPPPRKWVGSSGAGPGGAATPPTPPHPPAPRVPLHPTPPPPRLPASACLLLSLGAALALGWAWWQRRSFGQQLAAFEAALRRPAAEDAAAQPLAPEFARLLAVLREEREQLQRAAEETEEHL